MRASPHSSFTHRIECARITCEPARKLPRRSSRANIPSAAAWKTYDLRRRQVEVEVEVHASAFETSELHQVKSLHADGPRRPHCDGNQNAIRGAMRDWERPKVAWSIARAERSPKGRANK
jgi:hypothetical protein